MLVAVGRGELRRERRALARALESDAPGRRPREDVALGVGDRDDRVVERGVDRRHPVRDVLLFLLGGADALTLGGLGALLGGGGCRSRFSHVVLLLLRRLLLAGDRLLARALAGPGVGVRALAANGQVAPV